MFRHILVPLEHSAKDDAAVAAAANLAQQGDCRVTLLHVIQTIDEAQFEDFEEFYSQLEEKAVARLDELAERLAGQVSGRPFSPDRQIVFGKPVREILRYSLERGVDLIVLSSHRVDLDRPGEGWGTVSHQVSILSQCPVLLVK